MQIKKCQFYLNIMYEFFNGSKWQFVSELDLTVQCSIRSTVQSVLAGVKLLRDMQQRYEMELRTPDLLKS